MAKKQKRIKSPPTETGGDRLRIPYWVSTYAGWDIDLDLFFM